LNFDTPRFLAAIREVQGWLHEMQAGVLCCHGYKASLLGRLAARRQNVPVVAVSRGWTGENFKVRLYEAVDQFFLRRMDRVVCVSDGQAAKVIEAKVPRSKVVVIRNSIDAGRFGFLDLAAHDAGVVAGVLAQEGIVGFGAIPGIAPLFWRDSRAGCFGLAVRFSLNILVLSDLS